MGRRAADCHDRRSATRHDGPVVDDAPPPTATERAYRWTKGAILSGALAGGTLVSEGDVAHGADVSRTPVREAFLRLQAEGLLSLYPKRGALVVAVTPQEVADVIGARQLVEPWAFERAASGPDVEQLADELDGWVRLQTERLEEDEPGFQLADRAFHEAAVAAAGNALVSAFYSALRDRQLRMGTLAAHVDPDRAERVVAEHAAIAEAVRRGDPAAASALVHAHVAAVGALLGVSSPAPEANGTSI
jgi:DNA-binding GntR family transcriptional regulator